MRKGYWRAETGIFLGIWLVLLVTGRSRLFVDPGTFWHTVVGERILTSGEFIDKDPFSCTKQGEPWIAQQWVGECAMALVHRLAGLDGLLLAAATLVAGLYTWLAHRLIHGRMHWLLALLVTVLALLASA